ncbi:nucleic acid-binding protein [Hortaea werneckii]|nr:nucleic acid-binding protein [Hortaea werneckii]
MAPIKRKAVTEERPAKKSKPAKAEAADEKPAKTTKPSKTKRSDEEAGERKPAAKSVLQQEDRSFPRGGASVLTPLEHRQIRAQAERDVLFEQQTGQKAPREEDGGEGEQQDEDLFDAGAEDGTSGPAKKKQRKAKGSKDGAGVKVPGSGIKIQGLSYKTLAVGSTVLGYVTAITSRDVALALPNNLTGYVPITAVSELLNARIERLLGQDEASDKGDTDDEDVDLHTLFHEGQWLRATVTATSAETTTDSARASKRHIELSLDPRQANGQLPADNIVVNSMLQATVRSVEDHGIIMDLGLADADVKGFVSKKELGSGWSIEKIQEGQVMLCLVTGKGSNGKVLKLSPDAAKFSALQSADKTISGPVVSEAPSVSAFPPGTAVQILVTDSAPGGVSGKVMGMLDVSADVVHSGAGGKDVDLAKKFRVGSKARGRIIWALPSLQDGEVRKVGVSMLEHLLLLPPPSDRLAKEASAKLRAQATALAGHLPLSSIVEDATVTDVLAERGLFLSLPTSESKQAGAQAFAHISQVSDERIDVLQSSAGRYKVDSTHRARVVGFNPVDNLHYVSLKKSTLEQAYLRLEDVSIGEMVSGKIERLILGGKTGIQGLLIKIADGITGLVPEMHLSDVALQHPERKFREGFPVKARVLNIDTEKRHIRLTLKKSLLPDQDGDSSIWKSYDDLKMSMESKGTIVSLHPSGAVVQYFGPVRAWLPVAEMSEGFLESPDKHFRLGQTVTTRILSVDADKEEMKVSCKSAGVWDEEMQAAWDKLEAGSIVEGTVAEKSVGQGDITVDLEGGIRGVVRFGQLADGELPKRAEGVLKRTRVGQKLTDLVVLGKMERSRQALLSNKASFVADAKSNALVRSFSDVTEGKKVRGFVRNVTPEGVYVEFGDGLVGLCSKRDIAPEMAGKAAFGLVKDQTVTAWVSGLDAGRERFWLSMREKSTGDKPQPKKDIKDDDAKEEAIAKVGDVVRAKIASVKATQLNVRIGDGVQGRIDVSEVFDSWDAVGNKKAPLQKFQPNEEVDAKVLGVHDARAHRFLPISHRQSKASVLELSAKSSRVQKRSEALLSLDSVKAKGSYTAFINNHGDNCVWANLSPNVRGRIALMDLSHDVGQLQNLGKHFPIGSALKVTVKSVDVATGRLDLTARTGTEQAQLKLQDIQPGQVLPGRVTKVTERGVTVQLSDTLAAPVGLVEMADDFDNARPQQYNKNDIVRVSVLDVDLPNKKVFLSLRPSLVLSSTLPVKDKSVLNHDSINAGDLLRGFVRHVGEKGVLVQLGAKVDAFVRISDLSDQYVKDWKSIVSVDQLVRGRVLAVDPAARSVSLSLKKSHVDEDYIPPIGISDLQSGQVVTGKVRKVEDFGAFIDIDNTQPRLSGLCHRSEVAAKRVEDVRKLYSEGDVVKAKVLSVDVEKRKISLGLKASYFADDDGDEDMEDASEDESDEEGVELDGLENEDDSEEGSEGGVNLEDIQDMESDDEDDAAEAEGMDVDSASDDDSSKPTSGLKTSGFDWTGGDAFGDANGAASDSEAETQPQKKRKRKPEIKVDMTGDLDKYGPRSNSDFERQLLGQPNNSGLWIQYMAFQLQLSEIQKAREIAERALRSIHIREVEEKANIWIAWMNLEVEYGDDERVEEVFKQACQVQDSLEMHQKLASIYIDSGKHDKADAVFERIVANKSFRASPEVWLNYASFLMDRLKEPARARALLSRSLQSVPSSEHRALTAKFAALEFRTETGDPERGRTIFEGLVTEFPKWTVGWDMWTDLELSRLMHTESEDVKKEQKGHVRSLLERSVNQKIKKRRAKFLFKKWLDFEEKVGGAKEVERVKGLAKEFVEGLQGKDEE